MKRKEVKYIQKKLKDHVVGRSVDSECARIFIA